MVAHLNKLISPLLLPLALLLGCSGASEGGGGATDDPGGGPLAERLGTDDMGGGGDTATPDADAATADEDAATPLGGDTTNSPNPGSDCDSCELGSIKGVVCSPNAQVFVNDATVTVAGVDCEGKPFERTTQSDAQGLYEFTDVPCGTRHVEVEKGSYLHEYDVMVPPGGVADVTAVGKKQCFKATSVKLAVITGDWDEMQGILDGLGLTYDLFDLYVSGGTWEDDDWYGSAAHQLLTDQAQLVQYTAVFVNCGYAHLEIIAQEPVVAANIKAFIDGGGSLYTSDYAFVYAEWPWPDAIDFYGQDHVAEMSNSAGPIVMTGSQNVGGTITDPALESYLGKGVINVHYDIGPLVAVQATNASTVEHVIGLVPQFGTVQPLVMSFRPAPTAGKVIYTNFHNDAQATADIETILNYLVFTL